MKNFLIKSTTIAILLMVCELLVGKLTSIPIHYPVFIGLTLFFYAITNFVHYRLLMIANKNIRKFAPHFLAMNMIKMMVYFIVAMGCVFLFRDFAKQVLTAIFVIYLCFTVLEVIEITRAVKQRN